MMLQKKGKLLAAGALALAGAVYFGQLLARTPLAAHAALTAKGYVLQWEEGEKWLLGPRRAPVTIKVSPETGSKQLLMGTEEIATGSGIPVHRHEGEDEIIFIHHGQATAVVGDERVAAKAGATVYVPRGTWHGIHNADTAQPVKMLWIFSQPGMEGFFRDFSVREGTSPREFSPAEIEHIQHKHGMRSKHP